MESPPPSLISTENALESWSVDVTLSTFPSPRLAVVFPRAGSNAASSLTPKTSAQGFLASLLSNGTSTEQPRMNGSSASVTVDILPNAEVSVVDQNLVPVSSTHTGVITKEQESEKQKIAVSKLSRALVISGDIGIWTEWASRWNGGSSG